MKSRYYKISIFLFLMIILTFSIISKYAHINKLYPLQGYYRNKKIPDISWKTWFSGEFQNKYVTAIEDNIGLRNIFIRIYNQYLYSFFKKSNVDNIIIGRNNILFQNGYYQAYFGKDYNSSHKLKEEIRKLKVLQDELQKKNILMLHIIAPGKVRIMPECVPEYLIPAKSDTTYYDILIEELKRNDIRYIDMASYFNQIKDTASYPIFPKGGTHWSGYAITLVMDSLYKYIECKFNYDLTGYYYKQGYITSKDFRFTDNDLGGLLNLSFKTQNYNIYYPEVIFINDSSKFKPNLLTIGDSFNQSFWGFYPYFQNFFSDSSDFWSSYIFREWPAREGLGYIDKTKLKTEILKRNIILTVTTEINYSNFGFGFINDAYNVICEE